MSKEELFLNILNCYGRKITSPFSTEEYALIRYENFCKDLIQENKLQRERIIYLERSIIRQEEKAINNYNDYIGEVSKINKALEYIKSTNIYGIRNGKSLLIKYLNDLYKILEGGGTNE